MEQIIALHRILYTKTYCDNLDLDSYRNISKYNSRL